MNDKSYDLYFGSLKVGVVTQTDSDFPNFWGDIENDPALLEPQSDEAARFVRFLSIDRESIRLVDTEHEHDVSCELAAVNAELEAYSDYIESEDWQLIDSRGRRLPILCPIFRQSGAIVWRWNRGAGRAGPQ
jgi:hypothetical protein